MIYPVLQTISGALNEFIYDKWGETANGTNTIVQLDNVAMVNEEKNELQDKIIVTLIKVEEEASLKNGNFYLKNDKTDIQKIHPAVYLNLYLLFSVTKKNYKEALQLLSDTILFFQSNKVFKGKFSQNGDQHQFKIFNYLHDVPMQEVFELWSNLGNKQYPFALYKSRIVKIMDTETIGEVPAIETTNLSGKVKHPTRDHIRNIKK